MKKSALALILAVLMAVGLLTIGAAADNEVAQIGDEKYNSLDEAISKAVNNDVITLLKDYDATSEGTFTLKGDKSVTLDLGGNTLTISRLDLVQGWLTVKNGKVDCAGQAFNVYAAPTAQAGLHTKLVIEKNVTINAAYGICLFPELDSNAGYSSSIEVYGNIATGGIFVSGNLGNDTTTASAMAASGKIPTVTVYDGAVVNNGTEGQGIAMNGLANVTVNGGTIKGSEAIGVKRGTLTVNGGTFTSTGEYKNPTEANHNGTEATGATISITSTYNYAGTISVSLNGGSFTGTNAPAVYVGHSQEKTSGETVTSSNVFSGGISLNVAGGTFSSPNGVATVYVADKEVGDAEGYTQKVVTGGNFSGDVSQFVPEGMKYDADTGKVVIDEEKAVASIGKVGYVSLQAAITAANNGDTITLRKELNSENETFTITKDITITGEKMTVTRTAAGVAFEIKNGGKLTFDNLKLEINGDPDSCGNEGDAVTKGIDVYDGELFFIDSEVDFNNLRSAIVMQKTVSRANIVSSLVSANNVWGNFSNGGYWHIIGSSLNISGNKGSKGHGLSATELEIWDSTVNINFCGLLGLTAKRLDVDNSTITVNECGTQLPYTSEWSTDKKSYKYPVEIKNGGSVTIDEDSTVTLMNNLTGNVLYLVNSTLTADGTLNASIRTNSGSECYIVSIEGFNPMVVASGDTVKLPTVSKPGYIFMGWKCSDEHTHQAGETVTITKNMTFTAIWANMPDITPGTPDDDDEPVVPDFPFTDVREGQWFYEAVKYVYDEGIMNGMDRYTFDPNGSLTRAMIWTMLARHEGVDTEGGATWYAKAQEWAVEAGVSDGTDPMGNITREQLVTMLWRLNGSETTTGSLTGYTDYDKVSDWAGNAMLWATVNGIIEGDEANALNPTAGCTRAQAAAMIMRFCEYHEADSFGTVV